MSDEVKKNPAKWDFSEVNPEGAEFLKDALRAVKDPEMGYSVIELGLIRNVVVEKERVIVTMILTTPFCPYGPQMVEEVRTAAENATRLSVAIDLRMDPWDMSMMEEGMELDWGMF